MGASDTASVAPYASEDGSAGVVTATAGLPPTDPGFALTFGEEFDGSQLDLSRWKYGVPWGDVTTGEAQIYKPSAFTLDSGILTITATKGGTKGKLYTSGAINSDDRYEFTYGYIETRARVPSGPGLWPAVWVQSAGPGQFNEIDVFEVLGQDPSNLRMNLHEDSNRWKDGESYLGPDLSAEFHTYAVDWEPDRIVWYLDGLEVWRVGGRDIANPMCLIANLAVGGPTSWSGPPDASTPFPAEFELDYIRVYQRK